MFIETVISKPTRVKQKLSANKTYMVVEFNDRLYFILPEVMLEENDTVSLRQLQDISDIVIDMPSKEVVKSREF